MIMDVPSFQPYLEVASVASAVAFAGSAAPPAPQLQCEIRLPRWCIVTFDGNIESTQSGRYRTWKLTDRLYMKDGPLIIIEDTGCTGRDDDSRPVEAARGNVRDENGKMYLSVKYVISQPEQCSLEFRLPNAEGGRNTIYEQIMLFGILVCMKDSCSSQLAKFVNSDCRNLILSHQRDDQPYQVSIP